MNKVLNGLTFTLAYLDDTIIFSETAEQHLKHMQIVLAKLREANLKLKKSKCSFFNKEIHYLGHLLTTDGFKPQADKVKAIHGMKPPRNHKEVREFLGMVGYYRSFISRFADPARPMTKLIRKGIQFIWTDECQVGFEYLRTCLARDPILKYQTQQRDISYLLMPQIRLQQQCSLKNILMTVGRLRICLLPTSQLSFLILMSNGALLSKKDMLSIIV